MKILQAIPFVVGMVLLGGFSSEAQAQPPGLCHPAAYKKCMGRCFRCPPNFRQFCFSACRYTCQPACRVIGS
jgi:hypothetical protein